MIKPKGKANDHIDTLLQQSRTFIVNSIEHKYEDNDPIFFMREPNGKRTQLQQCYTCEEAFKNSKEMNFCQFCGNANCKPCSTKTRFFFMDDMTSGERVRGKICRLCDRKFYLRGAVSGTIKLIDMQQQTLQMLQKQVDKLSGDCEELDKDQQRQIQIIENQLQAVEPDIKHFEEVDQKYLNEFNLGEEERLATERKYQKKIEETNLLREQLRELEQSRFETQE